MICEKILGNETETRFQALTIDYIPIQWDEAFKKLLKKKTDGGREIGIRLDNTILSRGLRQGDILWYDRESAVAVRFVPCEVIVIDISPDHPEMAAKVCYEIGNKHATLLWGEHSMQFVTPFNEPTMHQLSHLHGISAKKEEIVLDFDKRISSSVNSHTH